MSSLDIVKSLYKPYKISIEKGVTIAESTNGKFVIKKQNKDLFSLFNYLSQRGFDSYPKVIHNYQNEENVLEYLDDIIIPKEQKIIDLINEMGLLHSKTVYTKNVPLDSYLEIKDTIENNIKYLRGYYETMFLSSLKEEFLSPSKYLFARNYYKYEQALIFASNHLDTWYEMVKDKTTARVSIVHNNLSFEHFKETENKKGLISWDNYIIDSPIFDFYHLYQNEYLNVNFKESMQRYLDIFELLPEEKELLWVMLSIPLYFELDSKEIDNVKTVRENIDYILKTDDLLTMYVEKT